MSLTTNAYLLTSLDTLDQQNAELLQERTLKMKSRQSLEITQNRQNLTPITQTTNTCNLNTAPEIRL